MDDMISIIIPVYQTELYLRECVNSVLRQTWTNLEILLIDDGSGEPCSALCDELAETDPRIRVIHQKNAGVSAARNRGLSEAGGDWVLFIDSDDRILPFCCEHALRFCLKNQADSVIFLYRKTSPADSSKEHTESTRHGKTSFSMKSRVLTYEETMTSLLDNRIGNFPWNRLCRRSLYEGVLYPEGRIYEDIGTTWRVMDHSRTTCFLNEVLYLYRQLPGSISHKVSSSSITDDFEMRLRLWEHVQKTCPAVLTGNEYFILASALKYCTYIKRAAAPGVYDRALSLIKDASEIPDIFSSKQKLLMRLLRTSPFLFHIVCRIGFLFQ